MISQMATSRWGGVAQQQYLRQQDVIDQPRLARTKITVIGAGAVGSFVVLGLAKIGAESITVYDPDTVETHNLPNQWFGPADIGRHKVKALAGLVEQMTGASIEGIPQVFGTQGASEVTICCVDSMDARLAIWRDLRPRPKLFIDSRMGAEVGKLFCVGPFGSWYEDELYPSEEAFRAPCTARATMYCASGLAAMVVAQIANYVSGRPTKPHLTIDFRNALLI